MAQKNTPSKGRILIRIVLPYEGEIKVEDNNPDKPAGEKKPIQNQSESYTLTRSNGKVVQIKSVRQLRMFDYLQGREQSYTSGIELAEVMSMTRNQALDALYELKAKGLVYYTHEGTKIKIIRVDDITLLKPQYNGVAGDESSCEAR